jgi:hypothetical protein
MKWRDVSAFAPVYAPPGSNPPYGHMVVVVMCVITFGAMCRLDDAAKLVKSDIEFMQNGTLVVCFRKRKSDQYR